MSNIGVHLKELRQLAIILGSKICSKIGICRINWAIFAFRLLIFKSEPAGSTVAPFSLIPWVLAALLYASAQRPFSKASAQYECEAFVLRTLRAKKSVALLREPCEAGQRSVASHANGVLARNRRGDDGRKDKKQTRLQGPFKTDFIGP